MTYYFEILAPKKLRKYFLKVPENAEEAWELVEGVADPFSRVIVQLKQEFVEELKNVLSTKIKLSDYAYTRFFY